MHNDNFRIFVYNKQNLVQQSMISGGYYKFTCLAEYKENYLLTGINDRSIKMWDLENGKCIKEFNKRTSNPINSLVKLDENMYVSSEFFVFFGNNHSLTLWDFDLNEPLKKASSLDKNPYFFKKLLNGIIGWVDQVGTPHYLGLS